MSDAPAWLILALAIVAIVVPLSTAVLTYLTNRATRIAVVAKVEEKAEEAKVDLIKQNETLAGIEHKTDGTLSEVTKRAEASDRRADILARQVQRLIDAQENGKEHSPDA